MTITQLSLTLGVQLDSRRDTRHTWSKWMMTPMDPPHSAHTSSPSRVTMSNTPSIGHVWRKLHHSMQSQGGAGSVHLNVIIYFSVQREPHWTRDRNFFHIASTKNINYFLTKGLFDLIISDNQAHLCLFFIYQSSTLNSFLVIYSCNIVWLHMQRSPILVYYRREVSIMIFRNRLV